VHHLDTFTTPELAACHERALVTPIAHVCVSHAVADELADGWGITATVIPNGVDAARFEAAASDVGDAPGARAAWRAELPPGPIVLAVGGIEPRKGTLDLVDAMARLRRSVPGARLVIAGGETLFDYRDYRAAFDARCAEVGIDPVVLGTVADDRLPALVASADVFAFPSTKEGFGLAAMEALAAGVPVVMRDLPVLREVFEGTATFAADADAIGDGLVAVLTGERSGGPDRRAAGLALARRHRWSAAAEAHQRLYRSVRSALTL
jgi:glycosyltransferase-like protein